MAQKQGGKARRKVGKSKQSMQKGRRSITEKRSSKKQRKMKVKWRWSHILFGIAALVAMAAIAVGIWNWLGQAEHRHADLVIDRAGLLEPHFWQTRDTYYNSPEETAKLLEQFGTTSLGPWVGFWGVVLDDGTVVLNLYKGEITYKNGVPVLAEVEPKGYDAMILEGLDLPEAWRGRKITITRENDAALTHFVAVSLPEGAYADGAPSNYYAALWVWTGDCYEFGLDAVPDEVYDPSRQDELTQEDPLRNGLMMSSVL